MSLIQLLVLILMVLGAVCGAVALDTQEVWLLMVSLSCALIAGIFLGGSQ